MRPRLPRAAGWLLRTAVPGLRHVHAQVAAYGRAWDASNAAVLADGAQGRLWVALGDSTAQGIGAPSHDQGYVGQLLRMLEESTGGRWRVLNLSRSGARAADVIAAQLPRLASLAGAPDLVTCGVGANDILRRTPLPRLGAELGEIIDRLPPGSVVATVPQGLGPARAAAANEVVRARAAAAGLQVADVWARTGPPWQGRFASDGFHPNAVGYADWAAAFAEALAALGWLQA